MKFKDTEIGKIPADWSVKDLREVADIQTGFPFESRFYSFDEGTLVVRGENISDRKLRWDTAKKWKEIDATLRKYLLEENVSVLSMDGAVGENKAIIKKENLPLLLAQRVACVKAKNGECQGFLNQVIMSNLFYVYCEQIKTGTTIAHISKGQIEKFKIPYPSQPEQYKIAEILSNLDAKIELNDQMNKTLEDMAQALFKHWFVDFKFPNEHGKPYKSSGGKMVETEMGKMPAGWDIKSLDTVAIFLNGLALQKYKPRGENDLAVIKIRELNQGKVAGCDYANDTVPREYVVDDGDMLFSWSGSLEIVLWCGGKGALNQHLFKVSSDVYPKWFYYYSTKRHLRDFKEIAAGKATTMGHIQRCHLSAAKVFVPPANTIQRMDGLFKPIIEQMIASAVAKRYLTAIRDSLLPKLMSGKIRVKVDAT